MDCPQPPDPRWAHQIGKRPHMTAGIDWSAVGSIATAVAVLVAAWQVHRGTTPARITFQDELARQHREPAQGIPVSAYLGDALTPEELERAFSSPHPYLHPTND